MVKYKKHNLALNSQAHEMWVAWQRAKDAEKPELQKKLDQHLKQVDQNYYDLQKRYG